MYQDDEVEMACIQCGSIFGMDEIEDFDDVHCPDCDSTSVIGGSEIGE